MSSYSSQQTVFSHLSWSSGGSRNMSGISLQMSFSFWKVNDKNKMRQQLIWYYLLQFYYFMKMSFIRYNLLCQWALEDILFNPFPDTAKQLVTLAPALWKICLKECQSGTEKNNFKNLLQMRTQVESWSSCRTSQNTLSQIRSTLPQMFNCLKEWVNTVESLF